MSTSIAHCPTDFTTLPVLLYSLKTTALVYLGKNTFSKCSPAPHSYVSPNQQWDVSRFIARHLWAFWGIISSLGKSPGPMATCGEVNVGLQWGEGQNSGQLGLKAWVKLA